MLSFYADCINKARLVNRNLMFLLIWAVIFQRTERAGGIKPVNGLIAGFPDADIPRARSAFFGLVDVEQFICIFIDDVDAVRASHL